MAWKFKQLQKLRNETNNVGYSSWWFRSLLIQCSCPWKGDYGARSESRYRNDDNDNSDKEIVDNDDGGGGGGGADGGGGSDDDHLMKILDINHDGDNIADEDTGDNINENIRE